MSITDTIEHSLNRLFSLFPQTKPPMNQARQVKLIAHRGAHDHQKGIIENTLPAFQRALHYRCWGCELDVRLTKENEMVVHHDPDLGRLFNRTERIQDLSLHELKAMAPEIPTLKEVIDAIGHQLCLFIELKTPVPNEPYLRELLQDLDAGKEYYLISLREEILEGLRLFPKNCQLLVPTHCNTKRFCQLSVEKNYGGVLGHFLLLNSRKIKMLKASHKHYGVGFVESKQSLYRELKRDIPWIFTNNVALMAHHLNTLQEQP